MLTNRIRLVSLVAALLAADGAGAFAVNPNFCWEAFGITLSHPWPPTTPNRAVVIPAHPSANDDITVFALYYVFPSAASVERTGQRVVVTIVDSGNSFLPNPPVVVAERIGRLSAGSYVLDVQIVAGWTPSPPSYPRMIANNLRFDVTSAEPVPTMGLATLTLTTIAIGLAAVGLRAGAKRATSG